MANRKSKFELSSIASVFTKEKLIWCRDKIENGRGPMQSALKTLHSQTTVIVYEIHQWYKYFEFTLRPCSSQLFRNSTSASPIHWQWNGKCKALGKCFSIASVVILSPRLFFFLHRIIVVTAKPNLSAQTVFVNVFRLNLMCFSFLIQLQGWEFSAWLISTCSRHLLGESSTLSLSALSPHGCYYKRSRSCLSSRPLIHFLHKTFPHILDI